jgi:hypothetical protein
MSLEDDLRAALIEVYEEVGKELGYWARYFLRDIKRKGARATAKQLLRVEPHGLESKGLRALREAGRLALSAEAVVLERRFHSLFTNAELAEAGRRLGWQTPRSVAEIAEDLNARAAGRRIGDLQNIRGRLHQKVRVPTQKLFDRRSIFDDYAYHVGGRTELQFNIGYEQVGVREHFRYGVAFSLEPSRNLPAINPLVPKIRRFNEFLTLHGADLTDFRIWHYFAGVRSEPYPPAPIPAALIRSGSFIFLGTSQPPANVDVEAILGSFDAHRCRLPSPSRAIRRLGASSDVTTILGRGTPALER